MHSLRLGKRQCEIGSGGLDSGWGAPAFPQKFQDRNLHFDNTLIHHCILQVSILDIVFIDYLVSDKLDGDLPRSRGLYMQSLQPFDGNHDLTHITASSLQFNFLSFLYYIKYKLYYKVLNTNLECWDTIESEIEKVLTNNNLVQVRLGKATLMKREASTILFSTYLSCKSCAWK